MLYEVITGTSYKYKGREMDGRINIVNPFRATMVIGTPGSGKSFSVVLPFIRQHLAKGFSMCVYDFKFPDLSLVTYNHFLRARKQGDLPESARFYVIRITSYNVCYTKLLRKSFCILTEFHP